MFLDLFSTITGALIAIFTIVILASIWALTAPKKKEDNDCHFQFDEECKECVDYRRCSADYKA